MRERKVNCPHVLRKESVILNKKERKRGKCKRYIGNIFFKMEVNKTWTNFFKNHVKNLSLNKKKFGCKKYLNCQIILKKIEENILYCIFILNLSPKECLFNIREENSEMVMSFNKEKWKRYFGDNVYF